MCETKAKGCLKKKTGRGYKEVNKEKTFLFPSDIYFIFPVGNSLFHLQYSLNSFSFGLLPTTDLVSYSLSCPLAGVHHIACHL